MIISGTEIELSLTLLINAQLACALQDFTITYQFHSLQIPQSHLNATNDFLIIIWGVNNQSFKHQSFKHNQHACLIEISNSAYRPVLIDHCLSTGTYRLVLIDQYLSTSAYRPVLIYQYLYTSAYRPVLIDLCLSTSSYRPILALS